MYSLEYYLSINQKKKKKYKKLIKKLKNINSKK